MKISTWLEDMLASNSDFKDTINQVLETAQLGDSFEEITYNYYSQNYFQIFESRDITNIISDNLSLRVYDKILKKIKGLHNKSLFKHSHVITISNKFFALVVHDKFSKEINEKAIIKDIERYQKVWISCEKIKDKMHNRVSENHGGDNLEKLFGNILGEIFTIFNIDQNEDIESNISNIDLEKFIECEKFIIDSRFLAIRVLFDFLDDDLAIESELLNHIDVINDWIDTRDLTSWTSYFTNADYGVFSKEINQIELSEVSKIYRLLDNTFTNIKCKITDQYSFINILNLNDRIDCELPINIDLCKQYSFRKFIKILKNELSSVIDIDKKKILYSAIYLKIYDTIKFKESLNEILNSSPYKTIDEVTYIICNSYFNFIENKNQIEFDLIINIKNVEGDILNHIGHVMPIIKNSDSSFLKTFVLFKNIYKQYINSFWPEIKNFTHILDSTVSIKFLEDEHRNVSAKNLYDAMLVMFRNLIDQEVDLDRHFLHNFHQYLNEILRSAIGIQNYHRFNFSYIINTALSIFEITHIESKSFSIKGKEKEDSKFNLSIDQNLSNANLAINLFDKLCKISNACYDGLIWKYTFHISQISNFKRKKQIFDNIFNILIKCNLELQKLIYILELNLNNNCLKIFEIILNSIDKKNSTFSIEIINILIGDLINNDVVFNLDDIENVIYDVRKIIENLDHSNFTLLKNYLNNSSSNKFIAFKALIDDDQLNFTKCIKQIKSLRINNRYSISDEDIKSHINNIQLRKDFDKSVLKKYISEVYKYLIDLANFNDEEFLESLNLFDKTEAIDLKLIAHIIDAVYRTNDIVLRPVQISAFLLSIIDEGNVFNRMSAGEGKSVVNWIIGAYKVLTENISYLIVTVNNEQGSLQAKNSNSFFKFLGISSNINPVTPQTDFNEYCSYDVIFATLNNHILFKRLNQVRGNKLSKGIILGLDEADEPRDSHIPIRLSILDSINNYDHNKAFFKLINNFVDLGITNNEQKVFYYKVIKNLDDQKSDGKNLTEFCSRKCKSIAATLLESNNNKDINKLKNKFKVYQSLYNNIKKMDFKLIFRLLKSAFESAEAAKNWIEGKNYSELVSYALINKGPLAKIVRIINIRPLIGGKFDPSDENTKFSYGLAQCIATRWNAANKHNLANFNIHYHIDPLSINITFDTTQNIIHGGIKRTYKQVIAFSATAGNDQEVSSMIDKQGFNYISYPRHNKNKIRPIFENFSLASFNNSSRARRDGYLTWLARNDREKIHYLVEVLMQRVEIGRINPCVILCNNLQEVYELQAKLEIIIQQNPILRRLIMGVQTAGYKTIPTLDPENGELYSIDERHYLNILKKFHIEDDKLIPLNQKIVEQASLPGVITIGTLKTEGRGVDFFNHNRGLTVIVYGCDKDTISWTTFEQAIRRGRCINNSIAGLILTRQEIKQNLEFFDINVDENKIIPSHFYNLLNLIAAANIKEIDKDRSFKQAWEKIQEHVINYDFENQEIKISILSNLLTNLKNMWDTHNGNISYEDLWQEAQEILNNEGLSNILPNQSKFLDDYKSYDDVPFTQQHPFIECSVQENYFLKALNAPHKLVRDFERNYLSFLIHKVTGIPLYDRERLNNYADSCLKLSFAFLIMAVGAKSNFLKFKNSLLAKVSTGFVGGAIYGLIFQDSIASDKKEHLDTWEYGYTATSATVAISSLTGVLYATNITIVNCNKHNLFNNTFLKNVPCSKAIQILFSVTYDCLSLIIFIKLDNEIKEKILDYLDVQAIYNVPSSFELN